MLNCNILVQREVKAHIRTALSHQSQSTIQKHNLKLFFFLNKKIKNIIDPLTTTIYIVAINYIGRCLGGVELPSAEAARTPTALH